MRRVITLGYGRQVTIGQYVAAVKSAKANPDATFKDSLCERWPATGREIVGQFVTGMMDRINIRGGAILADSRHSVSHRLARMIGAGRITRECKWCGSRFHPHTPNQEFCEMSCRHSYYN
jgi:hypothetical protein